MTRLGFKFVQWMIRLLIRLTVRLHVEGMEKAPASGAYIVVSNHLGRLDPALVYYLLDRDDLVLLVAEKYAKVPFIPWVVRQLNSMFIDRFNPDIKTVREALNRLKSGSALILAPEGTRSKTEALLEARPGASYLAIKAQALIVPVALSGTEDRVVKANLRRLRRSDVTIRVGDAFTLPPMPSTDRDAALQAATDEMMCRIAALLPEKYRGFYASHPRTLELLQEKP
jgi:1-acyl-sn-glycerol-3-phosphate acyltransferase